MTHPGLRRAATAAGAVLLAAALAACQSAQARPDGDGIAPAQETATTPAVAVPAVDVSPVDGAEHVRLDSPIDVGVTDGTVLDVTVTDLDTGAVVDGAPGQDGASWTSRDGLSAGTGYAVTAAVADAAGRRSEHRSTFTTLVPETTVDPYVVPQDGWTVGVGMPVVVEFDVDVQDRAAVERALSVDSEPALEGSWRWESDRQVQWRPVDLWPSGTTVTVRARLASVEVAPGVWGERDREVEFAVGSAMVTTVDVDAHTMRVERDGEVLRTMPITAGKAGFETRNGTKVIMSRHSEYRMDAATTGIPAGDPEYYDVTVDYAMRLTWSGEFIHAAPWSVHQQGRANVSHGCTGMSTGDARWLFERSKVGDVVRFTGSDRPLEWGNGYTAWEMDFDEWAAGSSL